MNSAPGAAAAAHFGALASSQPFRAAVYGNLALFALALVWFAPVYETNDDAGMNLISAGIGFRDAPDEHLLFTNVLVGLALKGLYLGLPQVAWYGWYQVGALLSAAIAATYCFLRAEQSIWQVVLSLLYFGAVTLPCLVSIQFTKTAFLLTLAGQWLLVDNLAHGSRRPFLQDSIAILLVGGGAAIRFHSALLAILMSLPAILCTSWAVGPHRAWRRVSAFAAAAILAAAVHQFDAAYYRASADWGDFYPYNALRAEFTDYNRVNYTPATKAVFDAVGWSENDLAMLQKFFFADPQRYSQGNLEAILRGFAHEKSKHGTLRELMGQAFYGHVRIVVAISLCAILLLHPRRSWALVVLTTAGLACFTAVFMFYHYDRLPQRVCMPLVSAVLASACQCPPLRRKREPPARSSWLQIVAILLAAAVLARWIYERSMLDANLRTRHRQIAVVMDQIAPRDDQLFVIWGGSFPYEGLVRPLEPLTQLESFKCMGLGVGLQTPMSNERLREFRIDDLCRAIYERNDVFLVSDEPLNALLATYVEEHYDARIVFRPVHRYFGQLVAVEVFQADRVP
jgi:hypothetical protein